MKQFLTISFFVFTSIVLFFCNRPDVSPEKKIAQLLLQEIDSFENGCKNFQILVQNGADEEALRAQFFKTRQQYKRFEWAAEYFVPATSRFVNGPPVQEVEPSGQTFEPAGLQIIESLLFPVYDTVKKSELIQQLLSLQSNCAKYKSFFTNIAIFDWQVFDAAKQEVFRIETLGISGFDDPLTLRSMEESAVALGSLRDILSFYDSQQLLNKITTAATFFSSHPDFVSFDRAHFIRNYGNPLSIAISDLQDRLNIHVTRYNRLLNQDAKTLFDTNAFNVNAYVPDYSSFVSAEKIALGKTLFADPMLSGTGTRSCMSCHQPGKAFSDGLTKNTMIADQRQLPRNTPTLLNAALQPALFYDSRVKTLEDQSRNVVQSEAEMHGSLSISVQRLWKDSTYRKMFAAAFPKPARSSIDTLEVMNAIGSYVRSLTALNSRFDEYMRGDDHAMSDEEVKGFNLFMGKAKCATCHYMPLFNGTFPPRFMKIESEVIGVPESIHRKKDGELTADKLDNDPGRFQIVKVASLDHAFKIPTVRNSSRTAPYMHNGAFRTLGEVVDFYNQGGGTGLGLDVPNQTLPPEKLELTKSEREQLIAFLSALDSH